MTYEVLVIKEGGDSEYKLTLANVEYIYQKESMVIFRNAENKTLAMIPKVNLVYIFETS